MFFLKLVLRNAFRARLRAALTVLGLVIAVVAFGLLQTLVHAWYAGVETASERRLIARNAISLVFPLPAYYRERIRAVEGVKAVTIQNWFGGQYRDERSFFAQFAVEAASFFPMYPELVFDPQQYQDFLRDRSGAAIGRQLAEEFGFKLGDRIPLKGTIYPGTWEFTVRAIYEGRDEATITRQMFFHWELVTERLKQRFPRLAERVATFLIEIDDPGRAADIALAIDREFANSLAETLTETEAAFRMSFVAMLESILLIIQGVSYVVIVIILAVAANTMAMTARERLAEYATLKALGFGPPFVARLIFAESMLVALLGGGLGIALTPWAAQGVHALLTNFPRFVVTPEIYAQQVIAALAVGVLAALVPMVRSARVRIVDGLRHVG
ncbi:MAG: ABC transporter permease [Burkholderiales bacterium]|jgi:putative ABC transport system permease protein|nr:ABC transporter permease [Burkholderiales bacterium]MCA3228933.1 ABC transporter permease [Burkholderiales bacterium]